MAPPATARRTARRATRTGQGTCREGPARGPRWPWAAGIVPLALGTDTGGSVRFAGGTVRGGRAAAQPRRGAHGRGVPAVPVAGHDRPDGPHRRRLPRTLARAGRLVGVRHSSDGRAAGGVTSSGGAIADEAAHPFRIGWLDAVGPTDPAVAAVVRAWLGELAAELGADVADTVLPDPDGMRRTYSTVQGWEAHAVHAERLAVAPDQYDDEVLARLRAGGRISPGEYREARAAQRETRRVVTGLLGDLDLLALPTAGLVAPKVGVRSVSVGGRELDVREALLGLTMPWERHRSARAVAARRQVDGLPVGLQLVGADGAEDLLLRVAERSDELWLGVGQSSR